MDEVALVLDGHSRAALETVQSLGRLGVDTHVSSESPDALSFTSRYPARRVQQPSAVPVEVFVEWLRGLDADAGYRLVVPSTETSLTALMALDEDDPLRAKAVLPSTAALTVALDKDRTLSLAHRLDIAAPASRVVRTAEDKGTGTGYPLVLKPVRSKVTIDGALSTLAPAVVRDETARSTQLDRWLPHTPVIEQQYVSGRGVGIEVLYQCGALRWFFAHERLHEYPLTGGASTYRRAIEPPERMLDATTALLDALSWHGVAMVEFKLSPDGSFSLMEINPRLWGSLALAVDAGVDFPRGLWSVASENDPGSQPRYRVGHTTRHPGADAHWMWANLRADRGDPLLLTRPRLRSIIEWLKPLTGTESWDHWDRHDLAVMRAMLRDDMLKYGRAAHRKLTRASTIRAVRRNHDRLVGDAEAATRVANVLMVCYGNICRSPFAERAAAQRLPNHAVSSTGFHPTTERSSPLPLVHAAKELGVDLSDGRSRLIDRDAVDRADLVLLMDLVNYEQFARSFPDALGKTTMLGLFHPTPSPTITDPYGKDAAEIRRVLTQIAESVEGLADWLTPRL